MGCRRLWKEQKWGENEFGSGLDYLLDIYVEKSSIQGSFFSFKRSLSRAQ